MVCNSLASAGSPSTRYGIVSWRRSNQTGGTGDARTTCGDTPSRLLSLWECAPYLLREWIVMCSLVGRLSDGLTGGHSMPGGLHGLTESLCSIPGSLLILRRAGGQRRMSSPAL